MLAALSALFFLSGASALIYQVLWLRKLSLIFGVTVYAVSTVLASFMAGLSIGSAAAGRIADRVRRPLAWFGFAEIAIAILALLSPLALDLVSTVYVRMAGEADSRAMLAVVRLLCSAAVLLPPSALMGATLPLVLRSSLVDVAGIGARVSLLYGVNTAGAIAGSLLAGFVLIGAVGIHRTFQIAAALNFLAGAGALALAYGVRAVPAASRNNGGGAHRGFGAEQPRLLIASAFALSGLTALALEVVWFRTLVLYYPATTYAFTSMLAMVLTGIAAGSLFVAPLLRVRSPALWWFGLLHALTGIAAIAGVRWLAQTYDPASAAGGLVRGAAITILPPALLMGMAFPVGVRLWIASTEDAGRHVGLLYAANLAGAIVGSIVAGFVLLPLFGSARSLAVLAGVASGTGVVLLLAAARRAPRVAVPAAIACVAAFMALAPAVPDPFSTGLIRRYRDAGRIFMRDEGVQTTVSVHVRELGGRQLYLDGLHQASDGRDVVRLHRQIGHLPVLLHPNPRRALVIGLGGGATAGAVSLHRDLEVDIVELAPGVVRAAAWFTDVNEHVLQRPNVRLHLDDARNYLLVRAGRYDVITADIIQPTHAGAGLLYSREYFELARGALADGGVMVQWVGHRSDTHYKLIARTFQRVFPHTTVWIDGSLLVGSTRAIEVDASRLSRRFADPGVRDSLASAGLPDPEALLAHYTAGPDELREFLGDGPILTDDRPLLEYYLSLSTGDRPVDLSTLRRGRPGIVSDRDSSVER